MFGLQKLPLKAAFALILSTAVASRSIALRNDDGNDFVTVQNGQFHLGDTTFFHFGTNAFYLPSYNDANINLTFSTMAANGISVVRTWAFIDVSQVVQDTPYFQILCNGKQEINTGASGLQRLDKVVDAASQNGIRLVLTLTNNWSSAPNSSHPPLFLPTDFGGMDFYVNAFSPGGTHDEFYTNTQIISAFKAYISAVVSRYSNNPTVLAWEIANDPRCASSIPASSSCNTHTITSWVNEISGFIKSIDSKHLVTAGDGGFYCEGCPKLFPQSNKRDLQRRNDPGPAFDGSFGVDTEDIINIPCIDFGSFQLFPDQDDYGTFSTMGSFVTNSIGTGNNWVQLHANTGQTFGKPVSLLAFGIVLQQDFADFVPFNASVSASQLHLHGSNGGVSNAQGNFVEISWITSGFNENVGGILQYQWTQAGLSSSSALSRRQANAATGTSSTGGYTTPGPGYSTPQTAGAATAAKNSLVGLG